MSDRSVVRNEAYQKGSISIRERHNERENETYYNADIELDKKHLNVYFKQSKVSYSQTFDNMIAAGTISTRGLKENAKVIDELIFDVNTDYFDRHGGYEYAKSFYEEAYKCAVNEIGGEEYILSAVMHADERNKALSEQYGRDVYHYHLHVVYVPVVDKEVLWTKRCKDPELVGKVKEVIRQVSHSKKWPRFKTATGWVNSYSLLQDRFHDHMKRAGYIGFERGERGSTAEHLNDVEYKTQQEKKRAAEYTAVAEEKQEAADKLDKTVEKKQERLDKLDESISVKEKAKATISEVEAMGHSLPLVPGVHFTADEAQKLKTLAKKSVNYDKQIADSKKKLEAVKLEMSGLQSELTAMTRERNIWKQRFEDLQRRVEPFMLAILNFPQVLKDFISRHWQERQQQKTQNREELR